MAQALERAAPIMDWYQQVLQREHTLPGGFAEKIYEAEDAGHFDKGTAPLHVRSFFRAGVDTTIAGIRIDAQAAGRTPRPVRAREGQPGAHQGAFEEALRLESPAQVMFRTTTGEVELGGVRLRVDTKVGYHMGAANRDPRQWPDPALRRHAPDRGRAPRLRRGRARVHRPDDLAARGREHPRALVRRVQRIEPAGASRWRPVNTLRTLDVLPLELVTE